MAKKILTTDPGVPGPDNRDSLTAGQRGPVRFRDARLMKIQEILV
jgi:catalase